MPKLVTIQPNPDYDKKQDQEYQAIKKRGALTVPYQTALENIRLSQGRFSIAPEKKDKPARINVELEEMSMDDLKVMMLSLGIKTQKTMKKSEVITSIRTKMSAFEIVEDDDEE